MVKAARAGCSRVMLGSRILSEYGVCVEDAAEGKLILHVPAGCTLGARKPLKGCNVWTEILR